MVVLGGFISSSLSLLPHTAASARATCPQRFDSMGEVPAGIFVRFFFF